MEKIKYSLYIIIFLGLIAVAGYWALLTLEPGSLHAEKQKQEELQNENESLKKELAELKNELRILNENIEIKTAVEAETKSPAVVENKTPTTTTPPKTSTTTKYKNQTLINELEKLTAENIIMKEKSRGTRVGTIQRFLNLYNKTSKRVDNDYGAGTKTDVINFQKAEGMTADGETGPTTYKKMIEWLKKQG
ncbi:MAG: peptidoglycan-binding protein [Candidatus Pacebacteria bacterium]|nr:peptidoglycan-binding protein [Candidatus Paceibacterota bacterium]MCF7862426.1 peptidoglycan-binding protein [Candidatus Paceibacterota bacterium]